MNKAKIDSKNLEFESEILGIDIVSIKNVTKHNIDKVVKECKRRREDYITSNVRIDNTDLIRDMLVSGFNIYGFSVILKTDIKKSNKISKKVRLYAEKDLTFLKRMSRGAFKNVHWYANKNLKKSDIDKIYVKWIENSCKGRADFVLVYEEKGEVRGYISCRTTKTSGIIDLFAVKSVSRGSGIGSELIKSALYHFKKKGKNKVEVKTELWNTAALNLYIRNNFRISNILSNVNMWLK
ncbi:GNAT family N-acetyltransferase [Candidatus Woesearchaeota archaeon]|nr:GNAT family N-acetyltransferase [Candidatus Woesearchaeota archaeon]